VHYSIAITAIFASVLSLSGCGGGGGGNQAPSVVSSGLKIFVTTEVHSGDFANDPTLVGSTAIQKADYFCTTSKAKPSSDSYKALLVDGLNRDGKLKIDWVLKPSNSYYQPFDNILIDTTTATAIFPAFFRPMPNPIKQRCSTCNPIYTWSGMGNASDFSTSTTMTCNGWGSSGPFSGLDSGVFSVPSAVDGNAFSAGSSLGCNMQAPVVCVQQ
jgi:hypothetical protein